ncbi:hypothetical protein Ddye_000328 [Dipteronia dyeriana]|uniref:Reverse transcriptase n=1 Tax=Dipteronia dyeriana TaxID=168575 RepID=A0AAD9XLI5_9ROSI|nr:hypothetical protein Ddye_000328 [Dipteronia dyeriana]
MHGLVGNIKDCTTKLGRWNAENRRRMKKELFLSKRNCDRCRALLRLDLGLKFIGLRDLDSLLEQEEVYWKQWSRENWFHCCDRNSRYFHSKTSWRHARNTITGLFDNTGVWKEDKVDIVEIIEGYFADLFHSNMPSPPVLEQVFRYVQQRLSGWKIRYLDANFSANEVKRSIFDMFPTKLLGIDGLPALFYQKFWPIVVERVTDASLGVLNERHGLEEVNGTLITFIPKVKRSEQMSIFVQ